MDHNNINLLREGQAGVVSFLTPLRAFCLFARAGCL